MKKFLVLFLTPVKVTEDWMKTSQNERDALEKKMKDEWDEWMKKNKKAFVEVPAGAGKTKLVKADGVSDIKNDVMMYSIVQADSHEKVSALFKDHPHLQIPQATIEVMEINPLTGFDQ